MAAAPYPSGEIFYAAFQARYGHGGGGIVAMGIPAIAMFLCGFSSLCSNSRSALPRACSVSSCAPGMPIHSPHAAMRLARSAACICCDPVKPRW